MSGEGAREGDAAGFRLPRAVRITASEEIRSLFRRGKRRKTRNLDVFYASSPAAHSRVGIVVPRHRQRVVRRNLLKRRLREIARMEILPRLRAGAEPLDLLLRARPEAYAASYEDLRTELVRATEALCSNAR